MASGLGWSSGRERVICLSIRARQQFSLAFGQALIPRESSRCQVTFLMESMVTKEAIEWRKLSQGEASCSNNTAMTCCVQLATENYFLSPSLKCANFWDLAQCWMHRAIVSDLSFRKVRQKKAHDTTELSDLDQQGYGLIHSGRFL